LLHDTIRHFDKTLPGLVYFHPGWELPPGTEFVSGVFLPQTQRFLSKEIGGRTVVYFDAD
jgi:hypothetical protein